MPFDELLFTAFDKGWYKTIGAIFTSLGEIISKRTVAFMSSALKSSNISSGLVPQALLEDVIETIWFLEVVLMWLILEWSKYDWTIKSIACVVPETLLSQSKWLAFFPMFFRQYLCIVIWTSQLTPNFLRLFHYHILRFFFSVNVTLIRKKRFCYVPKKFICNSTIFGNTLKMFLDTFPSKRQIFISMYFVLLSIILGGALAKFIS